MYEQSEIYNKVKFTTKRKYKKVSNRNHKAEDIVTAQKISIEEFSSRIKQVDY